MTSALMAITIILQAVASAFVMPFTNTPIALALIPIAVGAIIYGPSCGLFLGSCWSLFILVSGQASFYFGMNAIGTIITVLSKGALAGYLTGVTYNLLKKYGYIVAVVAASIVTPVINTSVYFLGMIVFFNEFFFGGAGNDSPISYLMKVFFTTNFLIEIAVSTLLSPAVVRICDLCFKKLGIPTQSK